MDEREVEGSTVKQPELQAFTAAAGMVLFAFFIRRPMPSFLLAPCGLILVVTALGYSIYSGTPLLRLAGVSRFSRKVAAWTLLGIALGCFLGILFRSTQESGILPARLSCFALTAAAIGATEELLYRGYIQGLLVRMKWPIAVILTAVAHTAYKSALFAEPPGGIVITHGLLMLCTLLGGIAFGFTRHFSNSVLPPLAAHLLFDILVYGDYVHAPWWVWF